MEFLSDEWIAALDEAARGFDPSSLPDVRLVIETHAGERCWHVVLAPDGASVTAGPADDATVRFRSDATVAAEISSGRIAAAQAFMAGELQIGGDHAVLMEHQKALAAIDDVFAGVRARTTYPQTD